MQQRSHWMMRPLDLMAFLNTKSGLNLPTIFKTTWKLIFWVLPVMQILLQQGVWSLVLQLQGSHRDGAEEAEAEVEVEVEAGKVLRSRDWLITVRKT